jgi:quercetin dioxygenase-like cupin family protein
MCLGRCSLVTALVFALLGVSAEAQPQSETPAVTRLVTGHLTSVVGLPFYFRLYGAHLPPAQHASYRGSAAMAYGLSGEAAIELDGGGVQPLVKGTGAFIGAGQGATIKAAASAPTELLLFIVSALPNQRPPFDRPAVTKELYRTPDAMPGLKPGPYEFSLARLTFPPGTQEAQPHYRTGAALNYILAGTGSLIADGKTQPMPAGTARAALSGWFHKWANPGDTPLVILEAQITQEGAAPVVPEPAK